MTKKGRSSDARNRNLHQLIPPSSPPSSPLLCIDPHIFDFTYLNKLVPIPQLLCLYSRLSTDVTPCQCHNPSGKLYEWEFIRIVAYVADIAHYSFFNLKHRPCDRIGKLRTPKSAEIVEESRTQSRLRFSKTNSNKPEIIHRISLNRFFLSIHPQFCTTVEIFLLRKKF